MMENEILYIAVYRKDGFITTWSEMMDKHSVESVINRVKYLKNWIGGKFIDIHALCDGVKFVYDINGFQSLLNESNE